MCLPGLHITLGIYLRLFTLLEDECHALDVKLAPFASGDRLAFAEARKKERVLLDHKERLEGEVKAFKGILSYLALNSSSTIVGGTTLTTDPRIIGNSHSYQEKINSIVSYNIFS